MGILQSPGEFIGVINELVKCDQQQFDDQARSAWKYANDFIRKPALIAQYVTLFN
ncbi:MAG: hypothetical protein WKI04_09705 [Ferruginibacter sp.]